MQHIYSPQYKGHDDLSYALLFYRYNDKNSFIKNFFINKARVFANFMAKSHSFTTLTGNSRATLVINTLIIIY